ncbi:MAG: hypothetical protein U1F41_08840 [Burkholderiales bacterium]
MSPAPTSPARANSSSLARDALVLLVLVAAAGSVAILRGQDANWDLQNYHYYNPWAWWNGRIFERDIAAAQLQTFHNPLLDLPFFAMVQWNWPPRVIAFVLAIPAAIAAFFLAKLLPLLFGDLPGDERKVAVGCAFAIGVTSAMGVATLGTTMNEWPGAALVVAALWLVVRDLVRGDAGDVAPRHAAIAGLLVGVGTGGKLTVAVFALGLFVALAARTPHGPRGARGSVREALVFALGAAAGIAIAMGPWAYGLTTHYGSPVFPYFNDWIRSPWWDAAPVFHRVYGPHTLEGWLLFPFHLVGPGEHFVTEVPYRDGRFPVAWGLAIFAGAAWLAFRIGKRPVPEAPRGVRAAWRVTALFIAVSFVAWTALHSVYRYIVALDLLMGAVIVTLLARLVRPGYLPAIAIVAAVALIATTRAGDWWHVKFGDKWFEVRTPPLRQNALVMLTTDAPIAYLLPMLPPDARHLGVRNTVNDPGRGNLLARSVKDAIEGHAGPLYQLTSPPGEGSQALAAHGLRRVEGSCAQFESNIHTRRVELCELVRDRGDAPR